MSSLDMLASGVSAEGISEQAISSRKWRHSPFLHRSAVAGFIDVIGPFWTALEGAHPRLAGNVALLKIGLESMREYARHLGLTDEVDHVYEEAYTGLKSEAASEQPSVETATAVDQWLSALRAMLQTQVVCLASTTS